MQYIFEIDNIIFMLERSKSPTRSISRGRSDCNN